MNTENRFYLRILSPVHVGCDEVYEPMGFVVNENAMTLTAFDPIEFFRRLGPKDREKYAAISSKGTVASILELYKFMKGRQFDGLYVGICRGLVEQYQRTMAMSVNDQRKIQQELNNFLIGRTSFNPHDNRPYIPGSAIKGALRTAYLNRQQRIKNLRRGYRDPKPLEKDLLDGGTFNTDPFRLLKVSDFMPVQPKTSIVYAVNEKKVRSNYTARGPFQIIEIIEPGAVFTGTITVGERHAKDAGIRNPLTEKTLFNEALGFYTREMKREKDEFENADLTFPQLDFSDGAWPLRIGRHSGAESLTIEGHRNIKIMKKRGERPDYLDKVTTFWLAAEAPSGYQRNNLKPFGWSSLGRITEEMAASFEQLRKEEENKAISLSLSQDNSPEISGDEPMTEAFEPQEETWEGAHVMFNAGGGGIVNAVAKDSNKAELRGKDKALVATDEALHKKLFEGKKEIKNARVVVHKVGKNYLIDKIFV